MKLGSCKHFSILNCWLTFCALIHRKSDFFKFDEIESRQISGKIDFKKIEKT